MEVVENTFQFPKQEERISQVETNIDGLLKRVVGLRELPECFQRLFEPRHGFAVGRARTP